MTEDPWSAVTTAVIVPVTLRAWPAGLTDGPLPLPFSTGAGAARADRAARSSYFNAHTARALYGPDGAGSGSGASGQPRDGGPRRGHCTLGPDRADLFPARVTAVEVLSHGATRAGRALVIVHLCLPTKDPLAELQELTVPRKASNGNRVLDWLEIDRAGFPLGGVIEPVDATIRPFAVTLAVPHGELPDGSFGSSFPWNPLEQWLFAFASARTTSLFPADPEDTSLLDGFVRLSQDWSAMVLRDGVSFVGRKPVTESLYLRDTADAYVRSIYLDALLLGLIQQAELNAIMGRLADLGGPLDRLPDLLALEEDVSRFRNTYWWQHLTSHGTGNRLLIEFQRQRATPRLFEQVVRELDDYSRHATLRADRQEQRQLARVNVLLSVLTVLTVPMTLLQVMIDARVPLSWIWRLVVVGASAVLLLLAFRRLNRRR